MIAARVSPAAPVLVLGLDMGDGGLIRHWSRQGRLPHFAALAASGAWLELESTAQVLHTSTWPTFATGTLPGKHGVYYPYQPKPGYQLARHIEPDQYGTATFWKLADAGRRRCVVYDIPETFPEPEFGGRAIFDWGTWAWYGEPSAQPDVCLKELESRFGPYPLGFEAKKLAFGYPDDIEQRLLRSVQYKSATAQWLLDRDEWDLAVVGFCETHPAGHYLWPTGVDAVESADERLFESLFHVYEAVDRALGTLRASLRSDTIVMVISGDGVRPNRCGWHLLPAVLGRLGYLASGSGSTAQGSQDPRGSQRASRPAPSLLSRAQGLFPAKAKQRIAASLPWRLRDRLGVWVQMAGIDWSRTRAFALPTDLEGCIRLNVKGREPRGIVEPGPQYTDLCLEIRARLEELVNPATDAPAVRRVWIRNEIYPGPLQEELPDLIVTWNDEAPLEALTSPRIGLIEGINPDPRPGTHSASGFLLAAGPGISTVHHGRGRLTDVAATVLELLRIEQTTRLDGGPLAALMAGKT
jgi:predicted AlkP superfamily phosphohydrolase/phosphomutase